MTTAQNHVQLQAAGPGSSFYYAFLFLPPRPRAAITAFHAFYREVGKVAAQVSDPGVAAAKLDWWRAEVSRACAGQPTHPIMQTLMPCAAHYGIQERQLQSIIEGCQIDLAHTRYPSFAALEQHGHRVAGVACEVAARICGQGAAPATGYAHTLGWALQFTYIIGNVGAHARRGRIYLPVDALQRHHVSAHEILQGQYSERFTRLMQEQAERAHRLYGQALALLPQAERRAQKPSLILASLYRALLREIEAAQFQVLHQRIALTPLRKLWLAWKMQALGRL